MLDRLIIKVVIIIIKIINDLVLIFLIYVKVNVV